MKVVAYARFSSDNQKEESIDAQLRAIREYCEDQGIDIVGTYTDEAKSATTDKRPSFQRMIADSIEVGDWDAVIVHKLDRFSRDRYDSAFYKKKLKDAGIKVLSVLEHFDDSPESIILEGITESMAAYFSANLSREVKKGQREVALQCKHNGGIPPLGYDVAPDGTYIINEQEAETVRMIFRMYADGRSYVDILEALTDKHTKRGGSFGKNSLHDLLINEKYVGIFTFNRSVASSNGKRNHHASKEDKDIIRIPGGIPRIIDDETWETVQERIHDNKHNQHNTAKTVYLLSGKLVCGKCGSLFIGKTFRKASGQYGQYLCGERDRKHTCDMRTISKDLIERTVISHIEETYNIDSRKAAEEMLKLFDDKEPDDVIQAKKRIREIDRQLDRLLNAIIDGINIPGLKEKVDALNAEKEACVKASKYDKVVPSIDDLIRYVDKIKNISSLPPAEQKQIINRLIDKITIYDDDRLLIKFKISTLGGDCFISTILKLKRQSH